MYWNVGVRHRISFHFSNMAIACHLAMFDIFSKWKFQDPITSMKPSSLVVNLSNCESIMFIISAFLFELRKDDLPQEWMEGTKWVVPGLYSSIAGEDSGIGVVNPGNMGSSRMYSICSLRSTYIRASCRSWHACQAVWTPLLVARWLHWRNRIQQCSFLRKYQIWLSDRWLSWRSKIKSYVAPLYSNTRRAIYGKCWLQWTNKTKHL